MTVWRAFATCILWIAVALCLFCFAPGPEAQSYPDTGELRGDPVIRGVYEWLALREMATASGADVKAMLWRSMACVLLAVVLAAGAWHLFRRRGRGRAAVAMLTGAAAKIDPEERRALLLGWPAGGLPETPKAPMAFRLAVIGLLVYLTVNLLSCLWSDAPWLSLAAAADRSIGILWCLFLAAVLRRRWASRAALGVTILSAAAALLGLWFSRQATRPGDTG